MPGLGLGGRLQGYTKLFRDKLASDNDIAVKIDKENIGLVNSAL